MERQTQEHKSAIIALGIMLAAILAAVLPSVIQADMMQWGYAVSFIGVFIALSAFVVFLMFRGRATVRSHMLDPQKVLARWEYSKEFWTELVSEDQSDAGIGKIGGLALAGIFALIGFAVFLADTHDHGLFLILMLGIALFFVFVGFASSRAAKRRIENSLPEAVISREGLFFKNILYTWNARKVAYLESVGISPEQPTALVFGIRQLSRGWSNSVRYQLLEVSVPIPPGQEQAAEEIVRILMSGN